MLTCEINCVRKLFLDSGIILSKYGSKPSNCVDKCTLKSVECAASLYIRMKLYTQPEVQIYLPKKKLGVISDGTRDAPHDCCLQETTIQLTVYLV